jgi:site-specific recombinase XerD
MKSNNFYHSQVAKGNGLNTARAQHYVAQHFESWCKTKRISLLKVDYNKLSLYLGEFKAQGLAPRTLNAKITALQHYFEFLGHKENPAVSLRVKGQIRTVPNNLFSDEELEEVFFAYPTYGVTKKRNQLLLSLAVFQAVRLIEMSRIELTDLLLHEGRITIPATRNSFSRTLELKPLQMLLFQEFLNNVRPNLKDAAASQLLFPSGKDAERNLSNLSFIIAKELVLVYPKFQNLGHVRQSRMALWVKIHGLRKAQYLIGHKFVSSTERYQQIDLETLKEALSKAHPF